MVGAKPHSARFPAKLPEFFIEFLTDPGDLVSDIFAGSNTTGAAAELKNREWLAFEERLDYVASSAFRFLSTSVDKESLKRIHGQILSGNTVNLSQIEPQANLFA